MLKNSAAANRANQLQQQQHIAEVKQQQAYIRANNLAVLMDTIMQQLLEERPRPDDPMLWIADRLKLERALRRRSRSLAPSLNATAAASMAPTQSNGAQQ